MKNIRNVIYNFISPTFNVHCFDRKIETGKKNSFRWENGPVEIVGIYPATKWWIFPWLCGSLPEGKPPFSYGFPMVFPLKSPFSYGFPMVFLWFSYGFPMVFPLKLPFSYGFSGDFFPRLWTLQSATLHHRLKGMIPAPAWYPQNMAAPNHEGWLHGNPLVN